MDRPGLDREDEDGPADRRTRPCGLWESVEHHFPPSNGQKWGVNPKLSDVADVSGWGMKIY